jgi:hypothetical protein
LEKFCKNKKGNFFLGKKKDRKSWDGDRREETGRVAGEVLGPGGFRSRSQRMLDMEREKDQDRYGIFKYDLGGKGHLPGRINAEFLPEPLKEQMHRHPKIICVLCASAVKSSFLLRVAFSAESRVKTWP